MKHIAQSLTLGLAVLAASTVSPRAADFAVGTGGVIKDFGSIKDYRNAAVPVPAPTPPNQYNKDWYVRGDLGYNLATSVDIAVTGGSSARSGDDLNGFMFGSIGFGRYVTPSLRAELSVDMRPKKTVTTGTQYFSKVTTALNTVGGITTKDTITYNVAQQDDSQTEDHTAFMNLYYDFHTSGSRFTPYIGAGIGLDSKRFKRTTAQTIECSQVSVDPTTNNPAIGSPFLKTCPASPYGSPPPSNNDSKYASQLGFAAALMVGAAFEVTPGVQWDAGYRLTWEGAALSANSLAFDGTTRISISDRIDHELRTGVRIDLN